MVSLTEWRTEWTEQDHDTQDRPSPRGFLDDTQQFLLQADFWTLSLFFRLRVSLIDCQRGGDTTFQVSLVRFLHMTLQDAPFKHRDLKSGQGCVSPKYIFLAILLYQLCVA